MLSVDFRIKRDDFNIDINFAAGNNDIAVLFGPSGCGKTTILRCIAGLERPEDGRILQDGKVFFSSDDNICIAPRYRRVGYMFQEYALFPHLSVKDNILYGVKKHTCYSNNLYNDLTKLLKISSLLDRAIDRLSGGEKQRVALVRALMAEPEVLLLDEPLSAIDCETSRQIQVELNQLQRRWQIPFILVTHNLTEVKVLGTKIFDMENGRIKERRLYETNGMAI